MYCTYMYFELDNDDMCSSHRNVVPFLYRLCVYCGGAVASWLVSSSPDRAVWVRALAGDTVLCSWARHFTLTVPLSTQVYKWVPTICWGNLTNCGEVTCDGLASRPGGVEILLATSIATETGMSSGSWESVMAPRLHFFCLYIYSKVLHETFNHQKLASAIAII